MPKQLQNVAHDYVRYANCWEDADILLEALNIRLNDRVLSIGSAGDNSFSLLVNAPEIVVAVDINAVQLALIALKKAAFQTLMYDEFLEFLGFCDSDSRMQLFTKVKVKLSIEHEKFWIENYRLIESGIIYQGKFEKYFELFRNKVLPLVHSKKTIDALLELKTSEEQQVFYQKHWNTWRWRTLFRLFFSKWFMGKLGRDPAFLKEVDVPVSTFVLSKVQSHLGSIACFDNYFLRFILKGKFGSILPHYARPENFELIKSNIDRLVVFKGLAEDVFQEYSGFHKFNLSNIFEYMDEQVFENVVKELMKNGADDAVYAYWNLMVPRRMSTTNEGLETDLEQSEFLSEKDKGFFYGKFLIDHKQ